MVTSTAHFSTPRQKKAIPDGDLTGALRTSPPVSDEEMLHYVDLMYRERQQKQRSLLAMVPATKGRDRIFRANPLMQPMYERMRSQIRVVE